MSNPSKPSVKPNDAKQNPMREILVDKVTVNICVGSPGESLENAVKLLEILTGRKPVETKAKKRNPVFKIRRGLPIGAKVTLMGKEAEDFLKKALSAKKNTLSQKSFDSTGNFSFGISEYIDFPGIKYDPNIGMYGFDVCVSLKRRGYRIKNRRIARAKIGRRHLIHKEDAMKFAQGMLGVKIREED